MTFKRILSPSAILSYKRDEGFRWGCPRKYYLRYIKKLRPKSKMCFIVGQVVHQTAEAFVRDYSPNVLDLDYGEVRRRVLDRVGFLWNSRILEIQKLCADRGEVESHFEDTQKMAINWLHHFIREMSGGRSPPEPEKRILSQKHGAQGIVDARYSREFVEIRDYKTSKYNAVTPDIKLQLAIYSLLELEANGKLPDRVSVHFLKFPSSKDNPKVFKPTQALVDWAAEEIRRMHKIIQSDREEDYPCLCGGWCEREFENVSDCC